MIFSKMKLMILYYIGFLLTSHVHWVTGDVTVPQDEFQHAGGVCNMVDLQTYGCVEHVTGSVATRYKTTCAARCMRSGVCAGFFWKTGELCGLHILSTCFTSVELDVESPGCNGVEPQSLYFSRITIDDYCGGNGAWSFFTQECQCFGGFIGSRCDRYARSCKELSESGYTSPGQEPYSILPTGYTTPQRVHCSFHTSEVRTFVAINGEANNIFINRNWNEYVSGFHSDDEDLWLGLELLHHYTTKEEINILKILVNLSDGKIEYVYSDFVVRGEAENYSAHGLLRSMTVDNDDADDISTGSATTAPADGCFTSGEDVFTPFSTPDHPSDVMAGSSCAYPNKLGWWFSQCVPEPVCNPMGQFFTSDSETVEPYHVHTPGVNFQEMREKTRRIRVMLVQPLP